MSVVGSWFADPADASTPVAHDEAQVVELAAAAPSLAEMGARVSVCRACPRLVEWREDVARVKRRAFADQPYWGRPVVGFGAWHPAILVLGLAPAAHGANRTGRNFTGDRSGEWLYAALHRAGLANQAHAISADDGLQLRDTRVVAAVRCAPPANKPTTAERDTCRHWLVRELQFLWPSLKSIVVLGGFAWTALWPALRAARLDPVALPARAPAFGHGVEVDLEVVRVFGCYHVSQQNTFTGRLTEAMLDDVLGRAVSRLDRKDQTGSGPR